MSVQSEISRLNAAKNSLKTAIESKGVAVPDSTKLDGYSALVDQISSGGDSNVVVVELSELDSDGAQTTLTDEQISLIFSTDKMVYIQTGAGAFIPRVNVRSGISIFYLTFDESLGSGNVSLFGNLILAIESLKVAAMSVIDIPTLPNSNASDNGKFLQVVNGVPAWSSLPIYNGEVE